MPMRESRVLRKLRAGETACCLKVNLADPRSVDIAAMCDPDCIWVCMEHVPTDWASLENQIRAAKVFGVDMIVRVSKGSYSDLVRPLEADATGIMVPHLMSAEEGRKLVHWTRFHPIGRRPLDGGNADGGYTTVPLAEYMRAGNEQRFLCVQIEDPEPLEELEEIAAIPGIDMLFFGPGDFSQGIGAPGQWDHPLITQTRKRIAELARANGKFAGTMASPETLPKLIDLGYQFLNMGADVVGLAAYFKDKVTQFRAVRGAKGT